MVSTGLPNAVLTGLVTGSIIAMGAIGLALVYNIAEVPNFAHGELLMIGAYTALFVNKPGTVPVIELLATGPQSLSTPGLGVLFVFGAGATLGAVYLLGGRDAMVGSWWPVDPPREVGVAVHLLVAAAIGGLVVVGTPSIWAGVLLAAVLLAVIAPLTERIVYRHFRAQGATLATMLIVSLGVSFVLRFGTQAIFGGSARLYAVPRTMNLLGGEFYFAAAKFFDLYLAGSGAVVQVIDTGPEGNPVVATVGYSWLAVAAVFALTALAAAAAYWWRERSAGEYREGRTVGPRLAGAIAGAVTFAVLVLVLPGAASVPGSYAYGTRFRVFPLKMLIVVIAIAMMATLHLLLRETKLGTAMRASSDNLDLAKVTGINTDRVMMATWIVAGLFAGIAGVMLGLSLSRVQVNIGFFLLLPMFAAVILGGIRSVYGVILGAYVVGLAMDVGFTLLPVGNNFRVPIAFIVLFVVLLIKPEGLVGGS